MEYSPLLKARVAVWIARYDRGRASQNSSGEFAPGTDKPVRRQLPSPRGRCMMRPSSKSRA
jgi:hypothetical protein